MAKQSLYFYDLETSGINPREARIMQFAGQRTDLDLNPIGEPDNILVKMTNEILPDPSAILVTKITPQQTLTDGITEREFAKYFTQNVATPGTTIVGYNSIRFDNEFIRFLLYRNFYDAYEWSYKNDISTWDVLDLARMTRALRPDGISWPFAPDGKPTNRLEMLTAVNKISHVGAHDALSDVNATISVAKLIKQKQPKLYEYLFNIRDKQEVAKLVQTGQPFVYTSGRYSNDLLKTTIAVMLADHPVYGTSRALVYDLTKDPSEFLTLTPSELIDRMAYIKDISDETPARLPVKELTYNKCPAVAPTGVLKGSTLEDSIDYKQVQDNLKILKSDPTFIDRVVEAYEKSQKQKQQSFVIDIKDADARLYDGFFNNHDQKLMAEVRQKSPQDLADYHPNFSDERLSKLLLLYKARQTPKALSQDEQEAWESYRQNKLMAGGEDSKLAKYLKNIQSLITDANPADKDLLQDLWLWGESIAPISSDY